MPLKFLKKCRQYNVTSKSLFVISVHHLLDTSTTVDCTVSSESKGQECLDNVCNRLQIHQPEFFGLRYVVKDKDDELKWIDLERSLSRQLEKYANGTKIYLRVRHYVTTGVRHLSDESTRYYYFLQLKNDIFEGKIACDIRTSILLALYCRQAEYDSYQSDKQQQQLANEHLKRSLVLPKNLQGLCNDDSLLDSLIVEVLQQNPGIQHLTQTQAEEMYIQCCQQLEGYGEERFQAKDTLGNDLLLGLAINGIVVMAENGRQYFPWKDFHTVTIDKRTIKIEQNKNEVSIVGSFIFHEAETARYFWKLCVTQHKFFKRYIDEDNASVSGSAESANGVLAPLSGLAADASNTSTLAGGTYCYDFSDSREDLLMEQQHQQRAIYSTEYQAAQQHLQPQLPHGTTALMSSNISLAASHQSGGGNGAVIHASQMGGGAWLNKDYANEYLPSQSSHLSNNILDSRIQSSSCLDLSNNNLHSSSNLNNNNNNNNNTILDERERLKAMLPTYRPAPDYETAVQLKYRTSANELHNINNLHYQSAALAAAAAAQQSAGDTRLLHTTHYYAGGSQPDVHNAGIYAANENILLSHLAPHRYPDVAQPAAALHAHAAHHMNANVANAAAAVAAANSVNIYSNIELAQRLQMMRSKPPPPYPVNRLSSSSTPDLAMATHRPLLGYRAYVSGSSPDLVSNRNLLNSSQYTSVYGGVGGGPAVASVAHQYPYMSHIGHSQPYLPPHGTFENLNMIEEQPSIMSQLRQSAAMTQATAQPASQSYEQHSPTVPPPSTSNFLNSVPANAASSPSVAASPTPAALQRNAMNGSIEPIYENVPLPHYAATPGLLPPAPPQRQAEHRSSSTSNSSDAIRNRTASIQSAPGGMQPPVPSVRTTPPHSQQPNASARANTKSNPKTSVTTFEPDEISMNIQKFGSQTHTDRAASSTEHFLEPTSPHRAMRAASAAPAIGVHETQTSAAARQHQHKMDLTKTSSMDLLQSHGRTVAATSATSRQHDTSSTSSLHLQFDAMNLSNASSSSKFVVRDCSTANTTIDSNSTHVNTTFSSSTTTSSTTKEGKRKKRWNILGRSKTPDKQKSATLGREKTSKSQTRAQSAQDDLNLPHRWSTGVSRLQPISGTYSREKLSQILNDKLSDTQLFREFEHIPKRRECARYDCALLEENSTKNSDPNFLPYDDNRVRITPTMENRHGYVNASHITATVGNKQRFYIVAQSPQQELTTRIFWQCVWEADVYLVVQLSDELNYIPPTSNQHMEFGQFQVYQEFSQTTDRCITSKLRLYHIQSRRYRSVWHLSYSDWAEQNCPRDVDHFLDFLEELNSVRMASINEVPPGHNTNPPVLIHCLEGGGRSGVTLTADLLLYTLDHNQDLDIPRVIAQLRHQRDSIIPSLAQYKFIYSLLISYLKRTRLI